MKALIFTLLLCACAMNPSHEVTYDREAVRLVVKEHVAQVRGCYERELKANPNLAGKMTFDWDILDEGVAKNAKLNSARSTLRNERIESCLANAIDTWKFPPPPPRQTVSITYPFIFKN